MTTDASPAKGTEAESASSQSRTARAVADPEPRYEPVPLPGQNRTMPSATVGGGGQAAAVGPADTPAGNPRGAPATEPAVEAAAGRSRETMAARVPQAAQARGADPLADASRFDPPAIPAGETRYRIQVLALTRSLTAYSVRQEVEQLVGHPTYLEREGEIWKVRVGHFSGKDEAETVRRRLRGLGYSDAFLVTLRGE